VSYETGGQQYVALTMNHRVWAFKLGGTLSPLPAPPPPPATVAWEGRVEDTTTVNLGAVMTFDIPPAGRRVDWSNDYALSPVRIRTKVGTVLTWTNTTKLTHTLEARDGSWSTKAVTPGHSGSVTMLKSGTYEYFCKEHPWSFGQIQVQ
jgi:plastocyanin